MHYSGDCGSGDGVVKKMTRNYADRPRKVCYSVLTKFTPEDIQRLETLLKDGPVIVKRIWAGKLEMESKSNKKARNVKIDLILFVLYGLSTLFAVAAIITMNNGL